MIDLDPIFAAGGSIAQAFPGYEPRQDQVVMAGLVADLLEPEAGLEGGARGRTVVIEAETGIGKTLAYLLPALLSGRRVVVSTATLNLQDQIVDKDLPLAMRIIGREVPTICLKGRQNYLCLYRWYQYRSNPQLSLVAEPWVALIDEWLRTTRSGDRAELAWLGESSAIWPKICGSSSRCLGSECPEGSECFLTRLRREAGRCRLLVVNHHLFFSDLALKKEGYGEVLPRYEAVIFDEAHHVENVATAFFGKSFSHYQVLDLLGDTELQARADLPGEVASELLAEAGGLRQRAESFVQQFPSSLGRFPLLQVLTEGTLSAWQEVVELYAHGLERLAKTLAEMEGRGEGWAHLAQRAGHLATTLREIALPAEDDPGDSIHWYERRERSVTLSVTPLHIAEELRSTLYGSVDGCLFTSATLSSGGSFAYIRERLGLDEGCPCHHFPSPFDYPRRTLLYVPENDFPEPNAPDYPSAVAERILHLLTLSRGRALVLCTSYRGMDGLAAYLERELDPAYTVLVQGRAARSALLGAFRNETHSVLLATASFWEGVDVVGEALSCVIIDKLPFEVPSDPVIQARIKRMQEEGGNPFFHFQVPRAILALRQGVGRLMRSSQDRGVIAIMDVRLFTKRYGKAFRQSLPPSPLCRDVDDVATFFRSQDAPAVGLCS